MRCRDYEAQVQDFLDGKLNDVQAEEFILHVQQCKRCYEELEIYFSIYRGIGRSDDTMIEDVDFEFDGTTEDLRDMLKQVLQEIEKRKLKRRMRLMVIILGITVIIAFSFILFLELMR